MNHKIVNNRSHKAILSGREEIAENTIEITFKLEKPLTYQSGQYLWVELSELLEDDPKGNRRAFSITNPSTHNGINLHILFRKSKSSFNRTLCQIPIGTSVNIIAPFGSAFLLPESDDVPLVLLSAGTGIAPFLCLVRDVIQRAHFRTIQFFHYEDRMERAVFKQEVDGFNGNGIQTEIFDRVFQSEDIKNILNKKDATFFVSGPQTFIDHVNDLLLQNEIKSSQIVFEAHYPTPKNIRSLQQLLETTLPKSTEDGKIHDFLQNQIFRMALDSSSSHIVITDLNGVIQYANASAERITGFRISEMMGQTPRLWGGLMEPEFYRKLWDMKLRRLPVIEEIINRRKSGEHYTVILHVSPINDVDGSLIGFMTTEEDITKLRNREEALETLSDRFILATTTANIGTWEWDVQKDKITSEHVLFKLYGIDLQNDPRGAFVAWQSTLYADDKERVTSELKEVLKNPAKPFDLKYKIVTPSGEIKTLRAIAEVERDENGYALRAVGVNWDITREEEVDRVKSEFISLASHELRTPITTIRWYTEMLLHGNFGKINGEQKNYLNLIYQGNIHLTELVNALLDVSRLELGKFEMTMESLSITQILTTALTELQPQVSEKKLHIETQIAENIPQMNADPKLLGIIFQNLFTNAIKYTPEKGNVRITLNLNPEKTHVVISVTDTGCGIPLSDQKSIFSKLFRATNVRTKIPQGTGLGLYLTKSIIDRSGGKIWFESEEDKGSTFYVSYPVTGMKM